MKRKLIALLIGVSLASASSLAMAHGNVSFGLYVGAPAYTVAPPIYYAPSYYAPPVYYQAPAYYYGPAYYRYGPRGARFHHDRGHHRGWDKHHRR